MKPGIKLIISGPSGAGKGTVINRMLKRLAELGEEVYLSISMTTRYMREGEVDGESYYFTDKPSFERLLEEKGLLEHNCYNGEYYGTPAAPAEEAFAAGKIVLFDIDINGGRQIRERYSDAVTAFLIPPEFSLLEERLKGRGTETEDKIRHRLEIARGEYAAVGDYDYIVVNDNIDDAVDELLSIITAERCRMSRREKLLRI